MSKSEETFRLIVAAFARNKKAEAAKMMGHPSIKANGKLCCCFFEGDMVFKLGGEEHARALALKGSALFDPGRMGRPMKEWVQVKPAHENLWPQFAEAALAYVKSSAAKSTAVKSKAAAKTVAKTKAAPKKKK